MRTFDQSTQIQLLNQPTKPQHQHQGTASHFQAHAAESWGIGGNVNGGWLLATAARAALTQMAHHDPLVATGYYYLPVTPGPVSISTKNLNQTRSVSTAMAEVSQNGANNCLFILGATDFAHTRGLNYEKRRPPHVKPREQCVPAPRENAAGLAENVTMLFNPEDAWWHTTEPLKNHSYECWLGHADGAAVQLLDLLMFVDAVLPAVFSMLGPVGWVPTIELSAQIRRPPQGSWLKAKVSCMSLSNGLAEEDVELWDESDQLVALSRQLFKVRSPTVT
ncbi:MAG: thioesterase family protein [Gammaproteobacteria bacterium]